MKVTAIATLCTLVLGAVAMPENSADRGNLDARAGCATSGASIACGQMCDGVVARACAACKDGACKIACQHGARMNKCLDCCRSRCSTC